ncbi:MAG: galactokinase [Anaerolineae bacterium]
MASDLAEALACIYGDDPALLRPQVRRYTHGFRWFAGHHGPGEVYAFHAPGRVNLIGEHTDYNHGYVLPVALDKDILLLARPRTDNQVLLTNRERRYGTRAFRITPDIPSQPVGDWANYIQGSAQLLEREYGPGLYGLTGYVDGALPLGIPRGSGLSSSSALTVVSAVALSAGASIPLHGVALAEACSRAEWYVGTRGGIMDQFISVLGQRGHALFLDCRPAVDGSGYTTRQVPLPEGYAIVVVDSGVRHSNTGPHFNRRVAECRIGVRLLQKAYPGITHLRDVDQVPWTELESLLPEVIVAADLRAQGIDPETILDSGVSPATDTFYVRRRCRHVYHENRRVLQSVSALETGDVHGLAALLREAHASARDDYEVSTPEIEALVEAANAAPGSLGARLTGAGWGGCIVAIVAQEATEAFALSVVAGYKRRTRLDATVFGCRSAAGAGLVYRTIV